MTENWLSAQQVFFKEFGDILASRYVDDCLDNLTDKAAEDFARYLRAARSNAGLSQLELATKAGISEAEIGALEHGLILSSKITTESLKRLSCVLREDIEDFALLLGRQSSSSLREERQKTSPKAERLQTLKQILLSFRSRVTRSRGIYGHQGTLSRNATKLFWAFAGIVLVGAVAGVLLGDSELFSPSLHEAKANRLRAETEVLRAQTAYEQRLAEEEAAIELQALRDRYARELELRELTAVIGLIVGSVVAIVLSVGASYYLVAKARVLQQVQSVNEMQRYNKQTQPSRAGSRQCSIFGRDRRASGIQPSNVSSFHVGYEGFLAFCVDFILSNQVLSLDYTRPDTRRRYYPSGISPDVAHIYFSILRRARVVISGTSGPGWILRQQIRKMDDIRLRIPCDAFEDIVNREPVPYQTKQGTPLTFESDPPRDRLWIVKRPPG